MWQLVVGMCWVCNTCQEDDTTLHIAQTIYFVSIAMSSKQDCVAEYFRNGDVQSM